MNGKANSGPYHVHEGRHEEEYEGEDPHQGTIGTRLDDLLRPRPPRRRDELGGGAGGAGRQRARDKERESFILVLLLD